MIKDGFELLLPWIIGSAILFFLAAWPYLLGTYIAVELGAWNPSTERFVVGWIFEVIYVAVLVALFVIVRARRAQQAAIEEQRTAALAASGVVYETMQGRSMVYHHGDCAVSHRSREAAQKCRKSSIRIAAGTLNEPSLSDRPVVVDRTVNRLALRWAAAIAGIGIVVGLGILVADPIHSVAEDASVKPCPTSASTGTRSTNITMPDLVGRNAGDVEDRLNSHGFTNVELSSANPDYKLVIMPSNWTVVSTDPAPGCVVNRSHSVVVHVTK